MKKILITGGAGFVGRHFTNYFLNKGYQVLVVDSIAKYTGALSPEKWKITKPLDFKILNLKSLIVENGLTEII